MIRADLHDKIDKILNEMGFQKVVDISWGSITIRVDFQEGKEVITVVERETKK